ncbi:APC family permease [Leucobacter sp. L43]|uniref:APC family permease n=1 Tax=Leucobacter sp. L43 TaxID=2798040 RepID=UPI001905EE0B|nr:APC family permease [Leucobacter sp. L43]
MSADTALQTAQPAKLLPRLGLLGVVFFGLAYMSPSIVTSTFGVVSETSRGAAPTAYLVATAAMLLTAIAYAVLARAYPTAGSAYTYVGKTLGRVVGFFAGWVILLDYLFLPMVAWLIQSTYLHAQFPGIPLWVWLLVNVGATTVINLLGIALADRVNIVLTITAMASVAALVIVLLLFLGREAGGAPSTAMWNDQTNIVAVSSAAAVAAYSFLGFDAISTLSEETKHPRRDIPRGIVLAVLIGGCIFVGVSFLMQLVHPGGVFENADTAGYTLSIFAGGAAFTNVNNLVSVIAGFGSGLAIQATSSRLLFVMGRDGVLPRAVFGRLSSAFRVPWINILLIGAIGMLGMLLDIGKATAYINFGAFLAFALVNIAFLVWIWRNAAPARPIAVTVLLSAIPVAGFAVDLYLFSKLHPEAYAIGGAWLLLGVVMLAVATRGFRRPVPVLSER